MPTPRRFERIAQDLEKLPCELHEEILIGLEFHQLIHLSKLAGPRLAWSLKNSPAPWGIYFRAETNNFQKLLDITDQFKNLCFKPPKKKGQGPEIFEDARLSFLHHRNLDWSSLRSRAPRHPFLEPTALSEHWLHTLHFPIIKRRVSLVFEKYKDINQDVAACKNIVDLIQSSSWPDWFSVDDLANYIKSDHALRQAVAKHLVNDLNRLATLYEAHSTRLKTPFAPQTRRSNVKHVPLDLRRKAQVVERKSKTTSWVRGRWQYHLRRSYSFPDLVPYDWCLRLFVQVLQDIDLSKSEYPTEMTEKCMMVFEEAPSWAVETSFNENNKAPVIAETPEKNPVFRRKLSLSTGDTQPSPIRPKIELDWLEAFVTVLAWMEGEFPAVVKQVRGVDWVTSS